MRGKTILICAFVLLFVFSINGDETENDSNNDNPNDEHIDVDEADIVDELNAYFEGAELLIEPEPSK